MATLSYPEAWHLSLSTQDFFLFVFGNDWPTIKSACFRSEECHFAYPWVVASWNHTKPLQTAEIKTINVNTFAASSAAMWILNVFIAQIKKCETTFYDRFSAIFLRWTFIKDPCRALKVFSWQRQVLKFQTFRIFTEPPSRRNRSRKFPSINLAATSPNEILINQSWEMARRRIRTPSAGHFDFICVWKEALRHQPKHCDIGTIRIV